MLSLKLLGTPLFQLPEFLQQLLLRAPLFRVLLLLLLLFVVALVW